MEFVKKLNKFKKFIIIFYYIRMLSGVIHKDLLKFFLYKSLYLTEGKFVNGRAGWS